MVPSGCVSAQALQNTLSLINFSLNQLALKLLFLNLVCGLLGVTELIIRLLFCFIVVQWSFLLLLSFLIR